jgi:tripartite-type tricarboxylate transporter receptor subunit TctC
LYYRSSVCQRFASSDGFIDTSSGEKMSIPQTTKRQILKTAGSAMALAIGTAAVPAIAQDNNTLRIVVPYPPGGSSDLAARIIANELQGKLKTPVMVENLTGAGGRVALQQIKRMPSDANVIVLVNPALMVIMPEVVREPGYSVDADFQPITQVSTYELALAVGAAVPVRELNHLYAWMRANPDKSNFGVPATGSIPHFFALMLAQTAGVKAPVVGYRGSAPLVTDLVGGHVPVAIDALDSLLPMHESKKVRILATSGEKRSLPSIPTLKEAGTNLSASGWNTFYAKSTMAKDKVELYAKEISDIMKLPAVREKFIAAKAEPISSNQQQTIKTLAAFKAQWVPVVKQSGLKFD